MEGDIGNSGVCKMGAGNWFLEESFKDLLTRVLDMDNIGFRAFGRNRWFWVYGILWRLVEGFESQLSFFREEA